MKTLLIVGRYQPYHNAHHAVLEDAASRCDHLYVGFGSANCLPSPKNPFTISERIKMIKESCSYEVVQKLEFSRLNDYIGEDEYWARVVERSMSYMYGKDWGLYASEPHRVEFFRRYFPDRLVEYYEGPHIDIHSTRIRELYFRPDPDMDAIRSMVPIGTFNFLEENLKTARWKFACEGTYT